MNHQRITGTTKITGLLGNPVKHSISPLIHNHAFASLGLDYCYVPLGCEQDELENLVSSLRALNFAGANVTIPYKSDVLPFCDEISSISQITGTVNTLFMDGDKLCGTTTDGDGFLRALKEDDFSPENKNIVILGNGGTARTLAMVLAHMKMPESMVIMGRNSAKVSSLSAEVKTKTDFEVSSTTFDSIEAKDILKNADLVVNCTPVGMHPYEGHAPIKAELHHKECYYFDAIYNPVSTQFLENAKAVGAKAQNGLKMLLFQGLESFRFWTGETVPVSLFDLNELLSAVNGGK